MKRFLLIGVLLIAVGLGVYFVIYDTSFYLPFLRSAFVTVPYRAEGQSLEAVTDEAAGEYEALALRGAELSSFVPGHLFSDYALTEEDYLRYLSQMADMGATAVLVPNLMDDDFYDALAAFNQGDDPLYLIQGINVADEIINSSKTAFESGLREQLVHIGALTVDAVHGRRNVASGNVCGYGAYRKDVSPWVAGWLITTQLPPDTIAFTDKSTLRASGYEGTYFRTEASSSLFESLLARAMDEIVAYEAGKYRQLRPCGCTLDPFSDFLEYQDIYARQLGKYALVNTEHILPTGNNPAGRFTAYRLEGARDDFSTYLSADQQAALSALEPYTDYLSLLKTYHNMPLLALFGASSGRSALSLGETPLTETAQGEALAALSSRLSSLQYAAQFIEDWQDVWTRRSFNTLYMTYAENTYLWKDPVSEGKNRGLLSYDPASICRVDGDTGEWTEKDLLLSNGSRSLSVKYNAEGIYLLIRGLSPDETAVIPMDVSPEVGSDTALLEAVTLTCDRNADFILLLSPDKNQLLVQERYDAHREGFLFETEGVDPFVEVPELVSNRFVPLSLALQNSLLLDTITPETRVLQRLGVYNLGDLIESPLSASGRVAADSAGSTGSAGSAGSTGSAGFNDDGSLSDFCFGRETSSEGESISFVEVRIPWLMLNMGDPSRMMAHKDYYKNYGVALKSVSRIWFGLSSSDLAEPISLQPFRVRGWGRSVEVSERLKESYYIMQELWKGGK